MENPQLAKEMGRKGQQRIQEHFDIGKMTESYIQLYHKYRRQNRKTVA
jgi:glycosyltransferase involved in cell wall biosynthesis